MRDLVFIAVTVGFFAVAALVVAACDRIVGPDPTDLADRSTERLRPRRSWCPDDLRQRARPAPRPPHRGLPRRRPHRPGAVLSDRRRLAPAPRARRRRRRRHAPPRPVPGRRVRRRRRHRGDRVFLPVERLVYRVCGIDPEREQRWTTYAFSLLAFSVVSVLVLYALQRLQGSLPFNPTDVGAVPVALAFNTAVSFVTNTNWQNYAGETTMSHLTQMAGLAVQNFVSAAVGISVAVALIRGLARRRSGDDRQLLGRPRARHGPGAAAAAPWSSRSCSSARAPSRTSAARRRPPPSRAPPSRSPAGPFASQEAIKEIGTNGGGTLNANSAHPFANPNGFTNLLQMVGILLIPFALTYAYGRMVKDQKQGWVVFAAMFLLWVGLGGAGHRLRGGRQPAVDDLGRQRHPGGRRRPGRREHGGQGGPVRARRLRACSRPPPPAPRPAPSTPPTTASPRSAAAAPLVNMMLGEVSPGGVGAGLYGMLIFALLAVFIAGLMVGRTPEYLGKKIQAAEMKLVVLYILAVPLAVLGFTGASVLLDSASASILSGTRGPRTA